MKMRSLKTSIGGVCYILSTILFTFFLLAVLSVFAMIIVESINGDSTNTDLYNKAIAKVVDYDITFKQPNSAIYYYITVNLEYDVDNKPVSSWTDDKKIGSRSDGQKYYNNLDKNATEIIYKKDNVHDVLILPVKEKIKFLWKGWVVIGSVLIVSLICSLTTFGIGILCCVGTKRVQIHC